MKHKAKPLLGIGLIILGLFVGGFVGWVVGQIASDVIRIVCMGLAGGLSFMVFLIPGYALLSE